MSRCANHALSQQIEHAYAAAERARDCAQAAAAIAARDCPRGPAREALLGALTQNEASSERMMRAVLRFGRDYGHLAFAFRYAPDSAPGADARRGSTRASADARRTTAKRRPSKVTAR